MKIKAVYLNKKNAPKYSTEGASGLDFKASEDVTIQPNSFHAVALGVCVAIPQGYEMQIRPRSGLMAKIGVMCGLGTIDSDYRGEIKAIIFNLGKLPFVIKNGDRICQGVVCKVERAELEEVSLDEFKKDETERGEGGFGSTGMK